MQNFKKNLCKELQTHDSLICHIAATHLHLQGKDNSCNFTLIHQWVGIMKTVNTFTFKCLQMISHVANMKTTLLMNSFKFSCFSFTINLIDGFHIYTCYWNACWKKKPKTSSAHSTIKWQLGKKNQVKKNARWIPQSMQFCENTPKKNSTWFRAAFMDPGLKASTTARRYTTHVSYNEDKNIMFSPTPPTNSCISTHSRCNKLIDCFPTHTHQHRV